MFQKEVDDTTNFGMFSFILEIIHDIGDKSVESGRFNSGHSEGDICGPREYRGNVGRYIGGYGQYGDYGGGYGEYGRSHIQHGGVYSGYGEVFGGPRQDEESVRYCKIKVSFDNSSVMVIGITY